jgi:formylglycine-generating enzyme required for sulfatase activity
MNREDRLLAEILFFLLMFIGCNSYANNIGVSNISLQGQNITNHYNMVRFDITWENSWRNDIAGSGNSAPFNWDAAWVFVKYRVGSGPWQHAFLNNTGHVNPAGSTITAGLLDPGLPFNETDNPGIGVFIFRDANGAGTFSSAGVQLRWNYGANGLSDTSTVVIRVYAIEQVYVPQGSFYAGSGGTETSAFYQYPATTSAFRISGEGEIEIGTAPNNLYYNQSTYGGDGLGPLPPAFPKGYNAFYCMKYEISQQQYVDFLNSLTQLQANSRKYTGSANRYRISGNSAGSYATANPCVACNNLNWADLAAYFDWSGLRPLTELEYEKACRGTLPPVPDEFAWGTTEVANTHYDLENSGEPNEKIASGYNTASGNAAYGLTTPMNGSINGPVRVGVFAGNSSNTGRVTAGATYYGILEMSGNLLEHFVTVGNPAGRAFTGKHGNGAIAGNGNADVQNWPGPSSLGAGFRGGYWYYHAWYLRISERSGAAGTDATRYNSDGGRGGRTAPLPE